MMTRVVGSRDSSSVGTHPAPGLAAWACPRFRGRLARPGPPVLGAAMCGRSATAKAASSAYSAAGAVESSGYTVVTGTRLVLLTVCHAGDVELTQRPAGAALPDPALVGLVGPSGSGKSAWAAQRYRPHEVVSSDQLRGVVGSGEHDLDASADAFAPLDQIVAARLRRGLTTVIDTLGLDQARRPGYLALGPRRRMPAVAVLFATDPSACRRRHR